MRTHLSLVLFTCASAYAAWGCDNTITTQGPSSTQETGSGAASTSSTTSLGGAGGAGTTSSSTTTTGSSGCMPLTCAEAGYVCGPLDDGCGHTLDCGSCPKCTSCGGGGVPGVCGGAACCPITCEAIGAECGPVGDGCGGVLQCGDCAPWELCGGGGIPSICGATCDPCATSADCGSPEKSCVSATAGCHQCWSHCDGSACQGQNTCVTDADCPSPAKCLCTPHGCTLCMAPL